MDSSTSGNFKKKTTTDDASSGNSDNNNTNENNSSSDVEHHRIQQLSSNLRTRLSLAMVKVQHGWVDQSFEQLEELHGIGRTKRPLSVNVASDVQAIQQASSSQDTTATSASPPTPGAAPAPASSTVTTPIISPSISLSQLTPCKPPVTPSRHRRTSSEPGQMNFTCPPSTDKTISGRHAITSTRTATERSNPYYEYNARSHHDRHQTRDTSQSPRESSSSPGKRSRWSRTSFTSGGGGGDNQQKQQMSSQEDADAVESLISLSSPQKLRNETNEFID